MLPLQSSIVGGGILPIVVTFLALSVFSAVTLHLAVLWVLGDEPHQRALKAAPVPVAIAMLFGQQHGLVVFAFSVAGAFLAVRYVYELTNTGAVLLTAVYSAITVALGLALRNLYVLL